MKSFGLALFLILTHTLTLAESSTDDKSVTTKMNNQRLGELISRVTKDFEGRPGYWQFELEGYRTLVITDEKADRMRIIVPITEMKDVDSDQLYRILQANFDSALDVRYSIAKELLWSAFIHPLSTLTDHQFIDGLAQSVNLAATYGTTYNSGALVFSQGDSTGEQNKYYKSIIELENAI